MKEYHQFIEALENLVKQGHQIPLGNQEPCNAMSFEPDAPEVLLFSPHPDDECITGLLPLRLMREAGCRIVNVPVTYGSNVDRQAERAEELKNACTYLGWALFPRSGLQPLEKEDVVQIMKTTSPRIVFMPHARDWNSRHIATHHLVMDALAEMPDDFSCMVIETEYWAAMSDPNLMVEGDARTIADLVAALSFHVKEVQRNPYHLSAPAWMIDNVRRGGELVGGQGGVAPDYLFATLYRVRRFCKGRLCRVEGERMLSMKDQVAGILGWAR